MRRPNRKLIALGLCAVAGLVVAGVAIGLGSGGGGGSRLETTGAYAPISVPQPETGQQALGQGADPDSLSTQGSDMEAVLSRGAGSNRYKLTILNTSNIGYVDSLYWSPPAGVTILKVVGSSAGHCSLTHTSGSGVPYPKISCEALRLRPPTCTCASDGGRLVITFAADRFPGFAGSVGIRSATPVVRLIPSYLQPPDLPKCAPGQLSTAAKLCAG